MNIRDKEGRKGRLSLGSVNIREIERRKEGTLWILERGGEGQEHVNIREKERS